MKLNIDNTLKCLQKNVLQKIQIFARYPDPVHQLNYLFTQLYLFSSVKKSLDT